jgi:hypothetical protein
MEVSSNWDVLNGERPGAPNGACGSGEANHKPRSRQPPAASRRARATGPTEDMWMDARRWWGRGVRTLDHAPLGDPRRHGYGGASQSQTPEIEAAAWRLARGLVVRHALERRHHVIVRPARVVVHVDEERCVPLRPRAQSFVDILQGTLSLGYVCRPSSTT